MYVTPEVGVETVFSTEAESRVEFSDLSERRAVKLPVSTRCVSRTHFKKWPAAEEWAFQDGIGPRQAL